MFKFVCYIANADSSGDGSGKTWSFFFVCVLFTNTVSCCERSQDSIIDQQWAGLCGIQIPGGARDFLYFRNCLEQL
jgi:hypothetical protein